MSEPTDRPKLVEQRAWLTPVEGVGLFMACAVLFIGASGPLASKGPWGFLALDVLAFALPPIVLARLHGAPREILRLAPPPARVWAGALLTGASMWAVVAFLVLPLGERLMPAPPQVSEELKQAVMPDGTAFWVVLVTSAIGPGLCEELLCRGALAPALERGLGRIPAIAISAAMFAMLHMSPYRLLPTFTIGLLLATLALRSRSTLAAMLAHAVSNAAILAIGVASPSVTAWLEGRTTWIGWVALVPSIGGIVLARKAD